MLNRCVAVAPHVSDTDTTTEADIIQNLIFNKYKTQKTIMSSRKSNSKTHGSHRSNRSKESTTPSSESSSDDDRDSVSGEAAGAAGAGAGAVRHPIVTLSGRNPENWTEKNHFCLVLPPVYKERQTIRRDDGPLFCLLTMKEIKTFLKRHPGQVTLFSDLRDECLRGSWRKHRIASHEQLVRGVAVIGIRDLLDHLDNLPRLRSQGHVANNSLGLETFVKYRNMFTRRTYPLKPNGSYDETGYNHIWGPGGPLFRPMPLRDPSLRAVNDIYGPLSDADTPPGRHRGGTRKNKITTKRSKKNKHRRRATRRRR